MANFIYDIALLPWPDYAGQVILGRFSSDCFQDTDFAKLGVYAPASLSSAVIKRRAEYLAGRYLAKQLLAQLGHATFILHCGEDRAPCWPLGIMGSLSHNADTVICALHKNKAYRGVGIDVETLLCDAISAELKATIISSQEEMLLLRYFSLPFASGLTLVFSAKESLFKAVYPQVQCYFDFLDVKLVALDTYNQRFILEFSRPPNNRFPAGQQFSGHYQLDDNRIITLIYY